MKSPDNYRDPHTQYREADMDRYFNGWLKAHDRLMSERDINEAQHKVLAEAPEVGGVVLRPLFGGRSETQSPATEDHTVPDTDSTHAASA